MDTQKLLTAIEAEIQKEGRVREEKIFLRLLKEVWQVDPTVPPQQVLVSVTDLDFHYFKRFMGVDEGDNKAEYQFIQELIDSKEELSLILQGADWKQRGIRLLWDVNRLRKAASQDI